MAIRSVADPRQFPPEECTQAAQWVVDAFRKLGFADIGLHPTADGSQAVIGPFPDPVPTLRPCCSMSITTSSRLADHAWRTPPFQLTEVTGRWYGRGAADCKAVLRCRWPCCAT